MAPSIKLISSTDEDQNEDMTPEDNHELDIVYREVEEDHHHPDGLEEANLEENCLKQLYPEPYQEDCDQFRILERVARLYINNVGVKKAAGMGSSSFRTFIRSVFVF